LAIPELAREKEIELIVMEDGGLPIRSRVT
jgi:hypothetical protein